MPFFLHCGKAFTPPFILIWHTRKVQHREKINGDDYRFPEYLSLKEWKQSIVRCHCSILTNLMVNSEDTRGCCSKKNKSLEYQCQKVGQPISTLPATGFMSNCLLHALISDRTYGSAQLLMFNALTDHFHTFIPST